MKKYIVNGYELQQEILLFKERPCRVFIPPVIFQEEVKLYWVQFLDDQDVELVKEKDLKLIKNGKLLYGRCKI